MNHGLKPGPSGPEHPPPRRRLALGLLLALAGCSDTCNESTQQGAIGELGNGDFLYTCGVGGDPACEFSSSASNPDYFPECIALHGRFDLEYRLLDDSALEFDTITPVLYIESVNQDFFRGDDDFEAVRTGEAAFVVRESERVLDIFHLPIVEPDDMDVLARDPATPTTELELTLGDTEQLRAFPRSSRCTQLGGGIPATVSTSDEAVVSVSGGDLVRIQAQGVGTAVVRIGLGELEKQVTVHVGDGPVDPDTGNGSGSGSDGSGSGGTGSGSDGGSGGTEGSGGSSGTGGSGTGSTGGTT
ncbi:hypothetical protein [Paraliomyxa miuraensis]|uniref:hypothetical protein n=1 Tax=Paraliomyxa miuraensis TaxID=376150 RepID=UPI002258AABD|nr:hypothetical protein [Paraliomyxa miuraensis]MCX4239687.1 hypothetical protein [Paraliomyxa miuraensis]